TGFGVGNASASATQALLLTVLQDVFSRVTTIVAAYLLGTSLYPETKTFRFLADVLNDASLVLDTVSPVLGSLDGVLLYWLLLPGMQLSEALHSLIPSLPLLAPLPHTYPTLPPGTLRVVALCLSGALRALCGLVAGGSKAALTEHFANAGVGGRAGGNEDDQANELEHEPQEKDENVQVNLQTRAQVRGDVGELNAKDASRETVVGLSGMLLGTLLIPHLSTPHLTYIVLAILIVGHLTANYLAVCAVTLRSVNRQRAGILWSGYFRTQDQAKTHSHQRGVGSTTKDDETTPRNRSYLDAVISSTADPHTVSAAERILVDPRALREADTGRVMGRCVLGVGLAHAIQKCTKEHGLDMLKYFGFDQTSAVNEQDDKIYGTHVNEQYVLFLSSDSHRHRSWLRDWLRKSSLPTRNISISSSPVQVFVCFRESYSPLDQLKAWLHAYEVANTVHRKAMNKNEKMSRDWNRGKNGVSGERHTEDQSGNEFGSEDPHTFIVRHAHERVMKQFPGFVQSLMRTGWAVDKEGKGLMMGSPESVVVSVSGLSEAGENEGGLALNENTAQEQIHVARKNQ
ncbi:vitamin B6 photo-protection and homoeostasis-domain-containing protein, partial [Hygrophoropsis aurantiaca]